MIHLASVMTGRDFWKTGVTLQDLGIAHLGRKQMNDYLREGVYEAP